MACVDGDDRSRVEASSGRGGWRGSSVGGVLDAGAVGDEHNTEQRNSGTSSTVRHQLLSFHVADSRRLCGWARTEDWKSARTLRSFRTPHRHVAGTLEELACKGAVLCEHSRAALLDGGGAGVGEGVHGGHLNLVVVCDPVEDGQGMY